MALCIGEAILLFGSVYLINLLPTVYGIGLGPPCKAFQTKPDSWPLGACHPFL